MPTTIDGSTGVSQVQDGSIGTADLANLAVTTGKLADLAVTPEKMAQKLTLATAQNTTSGTAIDFTGIPSWAKQITIAFDGVSTTGVNGYLVQIGTSGGIETTGYASGGALNRNNQTGAATVSTAGFLVDSIAATYVNSGTMTLVNVSGNKCVSSHSIAETATGSSMTGGGTKTLGGVLDRIRLTTVGGTDTFDAGSINILYEG